MAIGTAAALIGSSLIGGAIQGDAAKKAAKAQGDASNSATEMQERMYNQQRSDQEPWRASGMKALAGLEDPGFQKSFSMDNYQQDPGYAFRLAEGQKAINSAASARGMGNSGATMKALADHGQNLASQEYQNAYSRFNSDQTTRFNRLSSLAGAGQTATNNIADAGMNYGNQVSSNMMGAGNAQAAGHVGVGNAVNGAIGQGMNSWMNNQMMNKMFPGGTSTQKLATSGWNPTY